MLQEDLQRWESSGCGSLLLLLQTDVFCFCLCVHPKAACNLSSMGTIETFGIALKQALLKVKTSGWC